MNCIELTTSMATIVRDSSWENDVILSEKLKEYVAQGLRNTRFSFYKNILYKNIEDEMGQKVKNILRIYSS